jgi:hypothetical protein
VRRDLLRAARLLAIPTLALGVVVAFAPGRIELAARVYALVLCGALLLVLLAALRRAFPRETPLRRRTPRDETGRAIPAMLGRLEQEAALAVASSFDVHFRLRPRLRALADDLLVARRGISLQASPERARQLLGEDAWDLVRPDRPPPEDRLARGLPIEDLRRIVESLERL